MSHHFNHYIYVFEDPMLSARITGVNCENNIIPNFGGIIRTCAGTMVVAYIGKVKVEQAFGAELWALLKDVEL